MSAWPDASTLSCVFLGAVAGIAMMNVNSYTKSADIFFMFLFWTDQMRPTSLSAPHTLKARPVTSGMDLGRSQQLDASLQMYGCACAC